MSLTRDCVWGQAKHEDHFLHDDGGHHDHLYGRRDHHAPCGRHGRRIAVIIMIMLMFSMVFVMVVMIIFAVSVTVMIVVIIFKNGIISKRECLCDLFVQKFNLMCIARKVIQRAYKLRRHISPIQKTISAFSSSFACEGRRALVWILSRWDQEVRLANAAHHLSDQGMYRCDICNHIRCGMPCTSKRTPKCCTCHESGQTRDWVSHIKSFRNVLSYVVALCYVII